MKTFNRFFLLPFLMLCPIKLAVCQSPAVAPETVTGPRESAGVLRISVSDASGNSILNSVVVVKRSNIVLKTPTDSNGRSTFSLAHGIYEITTEIPGWYPVRRALVEIGDEQETAVTVFASLKISRVSLNLTSNGMSEPADMLAQPLFDEFYLPDNDRRKLNIVVQYRRKRLVGKRVIYEKVQLTYNHFTIRADQIVLDAAHNINSAVGNVWIENDGTVLHPPKVSVRLKGDKIVIK